MSGIAATILRHGPRRQDNRRQSMDCLWRIAVGFGTVPPNEPLQWPTGSGKAMLHTSDGEHTASEWRQHWPAVMAASAGMGLSTIATYSTAVFIAPLQRDFGWSRADITSGHVIAGFAAIVCAPWTGMLVDRFGPRRVGIVAALAMCLAEGLLSLATPSIWSWRALWVIVAVAVVLIQPVVWTSGVTTLFVKRRGLALAATLCGSGIGSLVTPPLTFLLISHYGWRMAFVGLAGFWGVMVLPLLLLFFTSAADTARRSARHSASRSNHAPSRAPHVRHTLPRPMLTRRFLALTLAGFCFALVVVPAVVTMVPLLAANGISTGKAAAIASSVGLASIFGRLNIGLLIDRMPARFVAAGCACLPAVGYGILLARPGSAGAATVAALVLGLALGAELDILAYLVSRYFPIQNFGILFGAIGGFVTLAGSTGPMALNAVYDHTHSYQPALWALLPLCAVAALLFLTLGTYPPQDGQQGLAKAGL